MKTIDRIRVNGEMHQIVDKAAHEQIGELTEVVRRAAERILDTYTKSETDNLLQQYLTKLEGKTLIAEYAAVENTTLKLNNKDITI